MIRTGNDILDSIYGYMLGGSVGLIVTVFGIEKTREAVRALANSEVFWKAMQIGADAGRETVARVAGQMDNANKGKAS